MVATLSAAPLPLVAYERRVRSWAKIALPLVTIATIGGSFGRGWGTSAIVPLAVLWALSAWWGLGHPVGRVIEIVTILVSAAVNGPGGLMVATVVSLSLSYRLSVSVSLALAVSVASMAVVQGFHESLPGAPVPPWVVIFPMMLIFGMGRLIRTSVLGQLRAQHLADQLGEANALLERNMERAAEFAAANERTRIARDLHDSLGHRLTISHVHLQVAERQNVANDPRLAKPLAEARAAVTAALRELRQCVALLREPTSHAGVSKALQGIIDDLPAEGFRVTFEVEGQERDVPAEVGLCLFRGLQEALTNAARHAKAEQVEVRLSFGVPGDVRLEVRDDGVGTLDTGGGHGLVGLIERATAVGATVGVDSHPGAGLTLTIHWRPEA